VDDSLQYDGTRVVVTGAASGMGAACATALTGLGAEVHALDVNEGSAPVAAFHRCDLADPAAIEATVAEIGGPVDSLFNCAGLPTTAPSQKIMVVNFVGHRHLTEALLPHMPRGSSVGFISSAAGMGWIMSMANLFGLLTTEGFDAGRAWCEDNAELIGDNGYGFSKEAINAYVAHRGFQLAPEGIRVNGIMPGPTDTPMMPSFVESMGEDFFATFPKPVGRNSTPEEQAWPLIMLNSRRSSYVTATTLMTDGGFSGGIYTGGIDPSILVPPAD
jgi:NAD(P)-dependent dehydrogenase (short-subunit alcohol dehydrogenase family)